MVGVRGSSNRIYSTRTIDFGETNLKCLSDFCHFFLVQRLLEFLCETNCPFVIICAFCAT